jgi:hypothetical protein
VIEFRVENGELKAEYGAVEYHVVHYHYDTFQFEVTRWDFKELLTFQVDSAGDVVGLTIKIE